MEINLEISNINIAASVVSVSPVFDRRETTTQVIVKDGQTIVISGILRDQESKVKRKVPLLGDIPLIGGLFTSIDNQQTRTELIAFVTPFIVESPDENDKNFNEDARSRLLELSKPLDQQTAEPVDPEKVKSRLLLERYKQFFDRDERGQRPAKDVRRSLCPLEHRGDSRTDPAHPCPLTSRVPSGVHRRDSWRIQYSRGNPRHFLNRSFGSASCRVPG